MAVPDPPVYLLLQLHLTVSNKPAMISLRTLFARAKINIQTLLISIFVPRLISSQHPQPAWQCDAEAGYVNSKVGIS